MRNWESRQVESWFIILGMQITSRFEQSHNIIHKRLIGRVKNIRKARLLKLNVEKTKLRKVVKIQFDAGVTADDEQIEVVELFKYLSSLKSADSNCNNDVPDPELEWPSKDRMLERRRHKQIAEM